MLMITVSDDTRNVSLRLQGRLAGLHVPEVERSWRMAEFKEPRLPVIVDLADVSFIDPSGKDLLTRIHRGGATLIAGGVTTAIVAEITRNP